MSYDAIVHVGADSFTNKKSITQGLERKVSEIESSQ